MIEYTQELEQMKKDIDDKLLRLSVIEKEMKEKEGQLKLISDKLNKQFKNTIDSESFISFFKKPYVLIPQGKNRILVAVPKFIRNFQVGWLWKETNSFYIYKLDQYSAWLGDVPQELLEEINFKKEIDGQVIGNQIFFSQEQRDKIKKKLGNHIKDITDTSATIIRGHEFDLIADMIESGCLPFKPKKVVESDLREGKAKFELRSYQKPAFEKFLETGATGLFHPTGAGKSMVAMKGIDMIKGNKIVFVPTRSLIEQWEYYIEKWVPHTKEEVRVVTYQGYRKTDEEYALAVFDECQKLPANTFSRLSLINTKYRIGLSASPHREDGRESYIFALTGFPVGINWQKYMETVGKKYHPISVHIVRAESSKVTKCYQLVDMKRKTLIFCDSINLGKKISKYLDVPFIYGESKNRIEEIENNRVCVVSRVMDLGVSIKDLERIVEVDFLFGSRQQELQRTGRLMHSEKQNVKHDIVMTEKEIASYGKRLWSLQEKGFTIKIK